MHRPTHKSERRHAIATIDTSLLLQRMLLDRTRDWFGATAAYADEALRRGEHPSVRATLEQTLNSYSEYEQFALWTIIQQANELLAEKRVVKEALTRYRGVDDRAAPEQSVALPNPIYQGAMGRTSVRPTRTDEQ